MKKLLCLFLFLLPAAAHTQDLGGAPLPEPYINQEAHDQVIQEGCFAPGGLYWNWIASGWTLAVQGAEWIKTQGELQECLNPAEPACSDFIDGPGGKLWKPISDNTGNPVFLLPAEYARKSGCYVEASNGGLIAFCSFRTIANGNRAHFDVPMSAENLANYKPIKVWLGGECWHVEDPTLRYD